MRKRTTIIAITAVLIIITGSFLIWQETKTQSNHENNPSPIPTSTLNLKITNFTCTGTWHGTTLGASLDLFSLNYTNLGNTPIENLTITLNTTKTNEKNTNPTPYTTYNPNEGFLDQYLNGQTYPLENLTPGETKCFEKTYFMWGAYKYVEPFFLTATIKANETILDQATIMIPISTET